MKEKLFETMDVVEGIKAEKESFLDLLDTVEKIYDEIMADINFDGSPWLHYKLADGILIKNGELVFDIDVEDKLQQKIGQFGIHKNYDFSVSKVLQEVSNRLKPYSSYDEDAVWDKVNGIVNVWNDGKEKEYKKRKFVKLACFLHLCDHFEEFLKNLEKLRNELSSANNIVESHIKDLKDKIGVIKSVEG